MARITHCWSRSCVIMGSPGWIPISPLPHWIMPCGFIGHSIWMIGYCLSRSHRLRNQRAVWVWAGFIPSTGNWLPPLHKKACSGCRSLVNQQRRISGICGRCRCRRLVTCQTAVGCSSFTDSLGAETFDLIFFICFEVALKPVPVCRVVLGAFPGKNVGGHAV